MTTRRAFLTGFTAFVAVPGIAEARCWGANGYCTRRRRERLYSRWTQEELNSERARAANQRILDAMPPEERERAREAQARLRMEEARFAEQRRAQQMAAEQAERDARCREEWTKYDPQWWLTRLWPPKMPECVLP